MWTKSNFNAVDQVTTGEMRTIYQYEQQQPRASGSSRKTFQLTGLSITIPCHSGAASVFVAYGDTDVFTLGQRLQPVALAFERTGGTWKLAAAVDPLAVAHTGRRCAGRAPRQLRPPCLRPAATRPASPAC